MKRTAAIFIEDILLAITKIKKYTKNVSKEEFMFNTLLIDAVIRNLEIIGEAARNISKKEEDNFPGVPWHELRGMRNILIHEYFGIDEEILWEVVSADLDNVYGILKKNSK